LTVENSTQRGCCSAAILDSVSAIIRNLAYKVFVGNEENAAQLGGVSANHANRVNLKP
jgi:hypothetical protein